LYAKEQCSPFVPVISVVAQYCHGLRDAAAERNRFAGW